MILRAKRLLLPLGVAVAVFVLLLVAMQPALAETNMIANPEFNTNLDGWFIRHDSPCGTMPVWESNGSGGGRANLSCHVPHTYMAYTVTLQAGTTYTISWWMWKAGSAAGSDLDMELTAADGDLIWSASRLNVAGDWESFDTVTIAETGDYAIAAMINHQDSWIEYVNVLDPEEEPPTPPSGGVDVGATCAFSYTAPITASNGSTGTATYSYTVPANLISNYSFEEGGTAIYPTGWVPVDYLQPIGYLQAMFWDSGVFDARTGTRFVRPGGDDEWKLTNVLEPMYTYPGVYQAGLHYRCGNLSETCSSFNQVSLSLFDFSYHEVAQTQLGVTNSPTSYVAISGTAILNEHWVDMLLEFQGPGGTGWEEDEIFVDDVWLWPITGTGQILCDPGYYPVPEPITTTLPTGNCSIIFGDMCFPPVTDTTCWDCQRPTSILDFGAWIAWLLCHVRNLFFCHLYNWFLSLGNWVIGIWNNLMAFFSWLPTAGQAILGWLASVWNGFLNWANGLWTEITSGFTLWLRTLVQNLLNTNLVQALMNFVGGVQYLWELFKALVQLFIDFLVGVFNAILDLIRLFVQMVMAIRDALATPAYDWDFGVDPAGVTREAAFGEQASREAEAGQSAWSDTETMYIFLLALSTGDQVLTSFGMQYIQFLIIGGLSVGLIFWTLRKWEWVLPL